MMESIRHDGNLILKVQELLYNIVLVLPNINMNPPNTNTVYYFFFVHLVLIYHTLSKHVFIIYMAS